MHCFASENQTYTGTWLFGVESWKSLKGQENLLLKNLQVKTCVENVRFLSWKIFLVGKYGIQSTNEMAFKRTVPLREFSISRHQIWCAHAIVVQRMHACACKLPSCWVGTDIPWLAPVTPNDLKLKVPVDIGLTFICIEGDWNSLYLVTRSSV